MKNFQILLVILLILVFTLLLAGCANSITDPTNLTPEGADLVPGASATEEGHTPPGLERVETPQAEPVTGEVPVEILDEILADLSKRTGAGRGDIQVVRAEAVVWNDGSLGCPKPGEFYIQMMINGYWVVMEVEGIAYDFRVSGTGHFRLCEE